MEKDLIEISNFFGDNREAVIYRNKGGSYELHLFEGHMKLETHTVSHMYSIGELEDKAEDFVTYM